jgi:hypothetical protein
MPRKTKKPEELPPAPTPPAPAPAVTEWPALVEYQPLASAERWRVEKFRELAAEFEFAPRQPAEQMAAFHEVAATSTRGWELARRLFGINPQFLPDTANPEDFRTLGRAELCASRGLEAKQLQAELDVLRAHWRQVAEGKWQPEVRPRADARTTAPAQEEFADDGARLLKEAGFSERMFESVMLFDPSVKLEDNPAQLVPRSREKNLEEREWFVRRVGESRQMLGEPMARTLVREALLNELYLSRLQDEMSVLTPGMKEFDKLDRRKADLETRFQKQQEKLQEMFPDLNVAGRTSFRQVISSIFAAEQEFYGDRNNARRDALFTAAELQVLLRQSVQNPAPQYRFSTQLLVVEAVHGLYDRNFRSALEKKPGLLKRIDAAVRAAIEATRQALNEPLVDLENGVTPEEGDNYDDLIILDNNPKTQT